jgi:hypothetical protein
MESPFIPLKGTITGNRVVFKIVGEWNTVEAVTGGLTIRAPSLGSFAVDLMGNVIGDDLHLEYNFQYPDLGDSAHGKFIAKRERRVSEGVPVPD